MDEVENAVYNRDRPMRIDILKEMLDAGGQTKRRRKKVRGIQMNCMNCGALLNESSHCPKCGFDVVVQKKSISPFESVV